MSGTGVREAAERLAKDWGDKDDAVIRIYWFPHESQIRLVEVDVEAIPSPGALMPFYFTPHENLPYESGVALATPDEENRSPLPPEWRASWADGQIVFQR